MQFKFENLVIWQKAMDLGECLTILSQGFPMKEKFSVTSQMCRATDSTALNIAEGSIRQSAKEFKKCIGYSIRSLAEVVTCLHKIRNRNYISEDEFIKMYTESYHLMNMMVAFKLKIR